MHKARRRNALLFAPSYIQPPCLIVCAVAAGAGFAEFSVSHPDLNIIFLCRYVPYVCGADGETEGAAFITGNGVGKPRGIAAYTFAANASYAWGKVGYIASGKSAAFTSVAPADKIITLQHALKPKYRPNATWLTNDGTLATMRQLKDGSGAYYLWQPDPAAGFGGRFLGSPVAIDDNIADVAANSYSLFYGDFRRAYTIVDRRGIAVIRDNVTKKGVTKFHVSKRVGGGITHFEAIKGMKFATS